MVTQFNLKEMVFFKAEGDGFLNKMYAQHRLTQLNQTNT